jgi:hypothetical protein
MDTAKQNKKRLTIKKRKSSEDVYYPVPLDFNPVRADRVPVSQNIVRRIVQGAVKSAYRLKPPEQWDWKGNYVKPKAIATSDQVEMVMHLIESLQPTDAIEAVLASQFAVTYIRAMEEKDHYGTPAVNLDLFEFGHKVLETLQKYRSKGAQQISVQYNVNQGQVVNIKNVKPENPPEILDGENI